MSNAAIQIEHLYKNFEIRKPASGIWAGLKNIVSPQIETVEAVKDLSFSIERGERVAFVGQNGAGKSTTIKMLSGILHPSAGNIHVLGLNPSQQRSELAYKIGTVFGQRSQLWYHLPAKDTFELLSYAYDMDRAEFNSRIKMLVDSFDIGDLLDQPVRQMSLGQRMRCEIVASLLHKPEVLFLDEPSIGLDVTAKATIRSLIREASEQDGTTVLLTSHDTGDMEQVCERVMIIDFGQLITDCPVHELRSKTLHKRVITFHLREGLEELPKLEGMTIQRQDHEVLVVEIDTRINGTDHVIQSVLDHARVSDIRIEDIPMEDIIQSIYTNAQEALA